MRNLHTVVNVFSKQLLAVGLLLSVEVWNAGAATRTASVSHHHFSINIGYAVNGGFQLYFSTYDGVHTWARFQSGVGWSGELRPSSPGSTTYRSDYDIYYPADGNFYGYGSITVSLPDADTDGDLLPDFLDRAKSGTVNFSGSATELLAGSGTTTYNITGAMSRAAGSRTGSYSVSSSSGGTSYGNFALSGATGTLNYDPETHALSVQMTSHDGTETVTGQTTYTVLNENRIRINGFTANSSVGNSVFVNTFELGRNGNRYVGQATANDGNVSTSWVDYNYYHLKVTDNNDADSDGIPDLSDLTTPSAPVISSQSAGGSFPGGSTIVLSVVATGVPSPDYQWQRDGVDLTDSIRLSGSRTSKLNVTNARRTDSGTYRVRVHNSAGFANSTGTPVKVKVSQRMDAPVMPGNGNVLLRFSDSDGGALDATHINLFTLQWSSNLTDWTDYPAVFTAASGKLERWGIGEDGNPQRFYRVLER